MKTRRAVSLVVLLSLVSGYQPARAKPAVAKISPAILNALATVEPLNPRSPIQISNTNFFTLNWEPYPTRHDGYFVLAGFANHVYESMVDVGTNRTWKQEGMKPGVTNYFFITAYRRDGTNVVFSPRALEVKAVYLP